ncbi:MAG: hypothetical protein KJN93_07745, partial [Alphaproteobacteria bacterium]|nr:hypothetical protein [Alphaproteobacteria bacterium]
LEPWGSHPALDPLYSGRSVQTQHHGFEMSRMDKIRSIVDWQDALDLINVCTSRESGGTNCGSCEKCLRTRVQLLACGALANAGAFAGSEVDPSELRNTIAPNRYSLQCFTDALEPLRQMGRHDLVDAIEHFVDRSERDNAFKRLLRKISKRLPVR